MDTLISIVYMSRASEIFRSREVRHRLKQKSIEYNSRYAITGVLVYSCDTFVQLLEGPESAVNRLYDDICIDERHRDVELLMRSHISLRRYAEFSMRVIDIDSNDSGCPDVKSRLHAIEQLRVRAQREAVPAVRFVDVFLEPEIMNA